MQTVRNFATEFTEKRMKNAKWKVGGPNPFIFYFALIILHFASAFSVSSVTSVANQIH
jgi:hypothetical protein